MAKCDRCGRHEGKTEVKLDTKVHVLCSSCMAKYRAWKKGESYPGDGTYYWEDLEKARKKEESE